jgi:hypothetical protein
LEQLGPVEHKEGTGQRKQSHSASVAGYTSNEEHLAPDAIYGPTYHRTEQENHALRDGKELTNTDRTGSELFGVDGEEASMARGNDPHMIGSFNAV